MPLTYPPEYYTQTTEPSSTYDALRDLFWFLNGTHLSQTSAIIYKCIDCYDGTTREQPTDGLMSNLSSGHLWKPGAASSLSNGNWAVFESPGDAAVAAKFQIYVKMEIFGPAGTSLMPYADFSVGGAGTNTPTLPARILGQPPNAGFSGDGRYASVSDRIYSVQFDEGQLLIRAVETGVGIRAWQYIGEVNPVNPESSDPRPFVFPRTTTHVNWEPDQAIWRRISLIDDDFISMRASTQLSSLQDDPNSDDDLGIEYVTSTLCWTINAGERYHVGNFRNIASCDKTIGLSTTTHTMGYTAGDFRFELSSFSDGNPKLVTPWIPGTALTSHTVISELSVPDTLAPSAGGGGGDTTPPVVTYVNPLPPTAIKRSTTITVDVTDDSGSFSGVQLRVQFQTARPVLPTEAIHGGDTLGEFEPLYENCTVTTITDGFQFRLIRTGGWPATPTFVATPVDSSGNAA